MATELMVSRLIKPIGISAVLAAASYLGIVLWAGRSGVETALHLLGVNTLIGLLLLSLLNYGLRFLRWHYYLYRLGCTVSIRDNLRIYIAGFALTTTPGKAGEMIRSVWLLPHGVPVNSSAAAFCAERIQDFVAISLLASMAIDLYAPATWVILFSLVAALGIVGILFIPGITAHIEGWIGRFAPRLSGLMRRPLAILGATRQCFTADLFFFGLGVGLVAWGCEALAFTVLLHAIGQPLSAMTSVGIYSFSLLTGALSFMPGGLGGSEASMIYLLKISAIPLAVSVSATLLIRLTTLWFAVVLGIIAIMIRMKRVPAATQIPAAPSPTLPG